MHFPSNYQVQILSNTNKILLFLSVVVVCCVTSACSNTCSTCCVVHLSVLVGEQKCKFIGMRDGDFLIDNNDLILIASNRTETSHIFKHS